MGLVTNDERIMAWRGQDRRRGYRHVLLFTAIAACGRVALGMEGAMGMCLRFRERGQDIAARITRTKTQCSVEERAC